jgi:hypothetical protein
LIRTDRLALPVLFTIAIALASWGTAAQTPAVEMPASTAVDRGGDSNSKPAAVLFTGADFRALITNVSGERFRIVASSRGWNAAPAGLAL